MDVTVAEIPKNSRETLRVTRQEFRGHQLVSMRVFFEDAHGEMRPGKQGLAVRLDLVPALLQALDAALALEDAE